MIHETVAAEAAREVAALPAKDAYDAPMLTTLGTAVELTTGPVLVRDESPAGMQA